MSMRYLTYVPDHASCPNDSTDGDNQVWQTAASGTRLVFIESGEDDGDEDMSD